MKKIKYAFKFVRIVWPPTALGLARTVEPYLIDTEEEVAEIPNLPAAWEGQRVALISDWQVGMWLDNTNTIQLQNPSPRGNRSTRRLAIAKSKSVALLAWVAPCSKVVT